MLAANEVVDLVLKSNKGFISCKPNIEKAYDNVDLYLLGLVVENMGLGRKWIGGIGSMSHNKLFCVDR